MKKIFCILSLFSCVYGSSVEELKALVLDESQEIWGWCSREKALSFIDLIVEVKPKICVEIGVFSGASFHPVASALKFLGQGVAIAIDPWDKIECIRYLDPDKDKNDLKWWAHQNMDHIYFGFLSVLRQFDLESVSIIFRSTSKKAAPAIGTIDILYLDGNHFEKVAFEDVQLYLPKVRPGGYIWLNDATWHSLKSAHQLLSASCDIVKAIDNGNCVLFRKRK
jgi:hypothetical protein